ncbi:MAG: hypothetical protein LBH58_02725 [Tannerellaceae bacterium]|jgi:hypothetical protein|nr:hypothetical protein [Tannerellaceae bacterium]
MIPKLHYYNPGHETVVLHGSPHYTPSANVRKMQQDLALLPLWYAAEGDYVLTEGEAPPGFILSIPQEIRPDVTILPLKHAVEKGPALPHMAATPWGLSPQSIHLYKRLRDEYKLTIDIPEWNEEYRTLTGRQTASGCYRKIQESLPGIAFPPAPLFFTQPETIEAWISRHPGRFVIKTPYSSSGRGLLWLDKNELTAKDKAWIRGAIQRQGGISIEPALKKQTDFALEFHLDKLRNIRFEGLSVFTTSERGSYKENILKSEDKLLKELVSATGADTFRLIKIKTAETIRNVFGGHYTGYIGVDMLLYETPEKKLAIHPCIEINMRYTMGMTAIRLFKKYIHPDAEGICTIAFEKNPSALLQFHKRMKKEYPPRIEGRKFRAGYLSLCPVDVNTNYIAYLVVR